MNSKRELRLAEAFVELADTLVDEFDVIDLLQQLSLHCCELLDVSAAAVLLAPPGEPLRAVAPCDPDGALAELLDVTTDEGPALDCHLGGAADADSDEATGDLTRVDLARTHERWPVFTAHARRTSYTWACALPLRLRGERLGSLLLLCSGRGPLRETDVRLGQALADAAAIGLVHERTLTEHRTTGIQLRAALQSRILIEQAKGVLAARLGVSVDEAFTVLRRHARNNGERLTSMARAVIDDGLVPEAVPRKR
jgi:GAF domain-containing protein